MENILKKVENLLLQKDKYKSKDSRILKSKLYEDIMNLDEELLELLLSDESIKKYFFKEIKGTIVFDKQKFAWFVESKEFLPDSYTRYTNKIGLTKNGKFISDSNDVVLDFPYKDCVLEGGQTKNDQKRSEIFYNEIIAQEQITRMYQPKMLTNAVKYSASTEIVSGGGVSI